jgi:hypothetical protein
MTEGIQLVSVRLQIILWLRNANTSKSEAARTWIQWASASPYVKSTLCPDSRTSSSVFSLGKCDVAATNAEHDPQQTPLAVVASILPSISPAAVDIDAAREGGPSALPSTKS